MRWGLFWQGFFRTLFVIYCVEAGIFLLIVPWKEIWDRMLVGVPFEPLRSLLALSIGRSFISAFGIVHLIWGAHDLEDLLLRRRLRGHETNP